MALSIGQIQSVLRQAGWPEALVVIMGAIALAESSGNPTAVNRRGEHSVGLLQINMNAHGTRFGTERQLYDPLTNARAALTLYNERQRQFPNGLTVRGRRYTGQDVGLTHWGAFTDGRYRRYLSSSQAAYGGGGGYVPSPLPTLPGFDNLPNLGIPSGATAAIAVLFALALLRRLSE